MIGSIKGKVAELANEYCLIETPGGVGYRVFMPSANLASLAIGGDVRVHTYTAVREDAILLFGWLVGFRVVVVILFGWMVGWLIGWLVG